VNYIQQQELDTALIDVRVCNEYLSDAPNFVLEFSFSDIMDKKNIRNCASVELFTVV